ncbi:MAG: NUDIX domain-containing protein [Hyphomicrobiales bacterium]|nr:NUDIX domain-containing protein [Hyphomicrobiales bacterium]
MTFAPRAIRVKSVGLFIHNGRVLTHDAVDRVKDQPFQLLMGGGVDFGEVSDAALRRELREEIGAEIANLQLLTVIENIYTFEGEAGHEIVFVYLASLADRAFYERERIPFIEPGRTEVAEWISLRRIASGDVIVYPSMDYKGVFQGLGLL